jgi:hypothetical protein
LALLPESGAKRLIALGMMGTLRAEDLEKASEEELLEAAGELKRRGKRESWLDAAGAAYRRDLDAGRLEAGSVLGWSEVLLERGDRARALVWLRRLTGMAGEAFEHEENAARLLDRFGAGEAKEFWAALGKGAGWRVATGPEAEYGRRVAAARGSGRSGWGSAELDLLAKAGPVAVADADKPYYTAAMEAVASEDPAVVVQRLTYLLAERPEDAPMRLVVFRAAVKAGRGRLADLALVQIPREELTGEDWLAAGEAGERLGEWGEAASAAAEARRRLKGSARAPALELLGRVQTRQEKDEQNGMRRPRVGELPGDRAELARRAE